MRILHTTCVACLLTAGLSGTTVADVLNMGGTRNPDGTWNGLASLETVPVGHAGNAADSRYGGYGSVGYTYNIGKYEVTAGQYTEFLNAVAKTDTYGLYKTYMDFDAEPSARGCNIKRNGTSGSYTYSVASDWANRPVNCVSWGNSARFCNWMHNGQPTGAQDLSTTEDGSYYLNGAASDAGLLTVTRKTGATWVIPSEDEWYKAAYYSPSAGSYSDYPTSSNTAPGRDLNDVSGNNANTYGDPYPIDPPYYTTAVGEFQNSASPYGTFDQGGNVSEWNEAVFPVPSYRGWRGGSCFGEFLPDSALLASTREGGPLTIGFCDIGFRVSEVPEPTSMAILTLGGIGMLLRRRVLGRYP